jgi:cytochrome c-type biogenesis protein CcmE
MSAIHKKFVIGGAILGLAVCYLGFAGVQSGWVYMLPVDRFVDEPQFRTQRVKLCGKAVEQGFTLNRAGMTARFTIAGTQGKSVPVVFHGVIPDMFRAGRDVVIEGKLDGAGIFQADLLMTKCASKYEAGKEHPKDIPMRSSHECDDRHL